MGDIGCFAARELRADPGRPAIAYQSRPSAQYGLEAPETGEGLTVAGVRSQSWIDPLECLHLRGAPLGAVRFDGDTSWFAWTVGYYPRGLGLLDVVMWAKANGVPVRRLPEPLEVRGNPPWWDGASGRAEAEERLNAHLAEFDFWWADLLRHIHKTGWW